MASNSKTDSGHLHEPMPLHKGQETLQDQHWIVSQHFLHPQAQSITGTQETSVKDMMSLNSPSTKHFFDPIRMPVTTIFSVPPIIFHISPQTSPAVSLYWAHYAPQPLVPSLPCVHPIYQDACLLKFFVCHLELGLFIALYNKTKEGGGGGREGKEKQRGRERDFGEPQSKEMFRVWLPSKRRVIILILAQTRKSLLFISRKQKSHKAVIQPVHMHTLEARGNSQVELTECFATSHKMVRKKPA